MTTLDLVCELAIAPVSDLSDVLRISQSFESFEAESRVDVRTYAGGRRRIVRSPGQSARLAFSFNTMTRDQYRALDALRGVLVLVRDQRGRRLFGVFTELSHVEHPTIDDAVFDVGIEFEHLTYSEVV